MMVSISNHALTASFSTKGAELQSLTDKNTATNFLWSGDAAHWGKFSPVLFPIVGALKDDTYFYEGVSYSLPRHGFARDMTFAYEKIAENEVVFKISHTEHTLKIFPFEFHLALRYKLIDATLHCTYEVENPSAKNLWFSIGAHPAFAVPINNEGTYTDYFLHFNNDEKLTFHHISGNLITQNTSELFLEDGNLKLNYSLFYNDALVFKTLKSDAISLLHTKNKRGLKFSFKDFPYFGIWAAKDANFVCLEPWCGIADGIDHHQELTQKEGMNCLAPNEQWQRTWSVTCF
jgi:galactose mutarotase-like enzyme